MGQLKMQFTLDAEVIHEVTYDKDAKKGETGIPILEMLAVELATTILSVTRKKEAKTPPEPQPGGHHPYNRS